MIDDNILHFTSVADIRFGRDPVLDAWLLHFLSENNLEYSIDPDKNSSPEQLRFMVAVAPDQVYVPCSDDMLLALLEKRHGPKLLAEYEERWKRLIALVETYCPDEYARTKILTLCELKYRIVLAQPTLIPSRLMKRFNTIFLTQSGQQNPSRDRKRLFNRRAFAFIQGAVMKEIAYACPDDIPACVSIPDLRDALDSLELKRLLFLSTWSDIWEYDDRPLRREEVEAQMRRSAGDFERLRDAVSPLRRPKMKILYLPDVSGGIMFDLLIIKNLLRLGHKVILVLREGFYFDTPSFWDSDEDPVLRSALAGAFFLESNRASKNELLRVIRENPFVVISDGSRERLNLYRTNLTFARAWKEADLILAKGEHNHRRLIKTGYSFTRDILCFYRDGDWNFNLAFKSKASGVRKFSEGDISAMSAEIVQSMRKAKASGKNVMFYSAIIGSVPGQTKMALTIVSAFVRHLREIHPGTLIINPAEHFEEGLDADDLMFMWEKVQRSGLIDVWRFQTHSDIEESFALMGKNVPAVWVGKDSTFSTGCTKEMHIALSVQAGRPEMQIIGPDPEKFFRRREYGVGKFCDSGIECA